MRLLMPSHAVTTMICVRSLGTLLLQVVFHSRLAEEAGRFDFAAVVEAITDKLIRRHPHVFEDREASDADGVRWHNGKPANGRSARLKAYRFQCAGGHHAWTP